ncbi:non-ribosomal peptide synthetase [Cytobacillus dafuensis]|nr:non-ribosomal peptide synthetase [Cytobacillus dafuensis]
MAAPEIKKIYPLSPMQEGMLFYALYSKKSKAYFEQVRLEIKKSIDIRVFEESFNRLIARHDILRSIFIHEEVPRPLQVVLNQRQANIHYENIHQLNPEEQEQALTSYLEEDKKRLFELDKDLLMRIAVFETGTSSFTVIWSFHHILLDGWSLGLLWEEFMSIYEGMMTRDPANLPPIQPYSNYINWLEKRDRKESLKYWKSYLSGYEVQASLPKKTESHADDDYDLKWIDIPLDDNLLAKMESHARQLKVTLNSYIQVVWGILLTKYNKTKDVVFGSVLSGRPSEIPGVEQMIGLFIQTAPVRITVSKESTFEELLVKVQKDALASQEHSFVPLADIQAQSDLGKELLNHLVMFENYPLNTNLHDEREHKLSVSKMDIIEHTNYDFQLLVIPGEHYNVRLSFNATVYEQELMKNISVHFHNLLKQVTDFPGVAINDIEILTKSEKQKILEFSTGNNVKLRKDIMIHEILQEQATRIPDKIALRFGNEYLTYKQLNEKSNQLASVLQENGLRAGETVGIRLNRSLEMVIGIYGILKAGGAYLPIDPSFPNERTSYLLEDTNTRYLLTKSDIKPLNSGFEGTTLLLDNQNLYTGDVKNIDSRNSPEDLIYVIYTSGSTGKPKGVMVQHNSVMNRLYWMQREYPITEDDVILQKTPFTFDVSVWELFWWTITGSSLCLLAPGGEKDPEVLVNTIYQNDVTILHFVPSMLQVFLKYVEDKKETVKQLSLVKYFFASGEALLLNQVHKFNELLFTANDTKLINLYGPTEATVDVSYYDCSTKCIDGRVPIGKPIDNVQLYIVDAYNRLMPVGVIGELCIAGDGLARGYLNRHDLTNEKFVNNPFNKGTKMYRTGDLARWLSNGQIEYLGRLDHQVKVRGYRIELQEIEAFLLEHVKVSEAVVTLRKDVSNEGYLCAYVVLKRDWIKDSSVIQSELKEFLGTNVPGYMVPAHIVTLSKMPLTPNGKLDRKSLPEPKVLLNNRYETPQAGTEQLIAEIWKEILGIKDIGVHDDFFDLGGHSLKATMLVARLKKIIGKTIPLSEFFENSTIRKLAEKLELETIEQKKEDIQQAVISSSYPLSSSQQRLFVLNQFEEIGTSYNMPNALIIDGAIDIKQLRASIHQVVRRHETLRTVFDIHDGKPVQIIKDTIEVEVEQVNAIGEAISQIASNFVQPFNLNEGPLFRVSLVTLNENRHLLLFDIHHILSDGISMNILVKEVLSRYKGQEFEPLSIQYKDFAVWQQSEKNADLYLKQQNYWLNQFKNEPVPLDLPLKGKRPAIQSFEGNRLSGKFDPELVKKLKNLVQETESSVYMILMAAYNILLSKYSGQEDIVIGSPVSGRSREEIQAIIGVFVNMLPMRNYPSGAKSFRSFLQDVKKKTLDALEHQDYPFEDLIEKLELRRDTSHHPLFDVVLVHQNMEQTQFILDNTIVTSFELPQQTSKFDLTLETVEETKGISFSWEYKTSLFSEEMINQISTHFIEILKKVVEQPDSPISQFDVVTIEEQEQIKQQFNKMDTDYPKHETIHTIFEKQVENFPENRAISFAGHFMTYRELNNCVNQLGSKLKKTGIGPEKLAIILMDRSPNMIISILAVLKAGGAYVPIDPSYPKERIQFIIDDCEAQIILSEAELPKGLAFKGELVRVDKVNLEMDRPTPNLPIEAKAENLAYIIYTSGTTGKPKGVMIEHRNVVRLLKNDSFLFDFDENDVWTVFHSYSFDFSVWEIFGALLYGGTSVIVSKETAQNPELFLHVLEKEKVTILNQTPSAFSSLIKQEQSSSVNLSLRYIIFGGEALSPSVLKGWYKKYPDVRLINMYGITETTVHVTYKEITWQDIQGETSPIGQPIPTLAIYILDKWGNLTPFGVPGELCIAGDGLARGYLNQPELTAEKFIVHQNEAGSRLYRSGDLARWLPDGSIEYLGRIDDQVKIRGHRIELGEIEAQLLQMEGVEDAVVLTRNDADGTAYLCGYLVSREDVTISAIRNHLSRTLPDYMIPASYVLLDQLPLTPNGKVDKRALPEPEGLIHLGVEYEAPQGEAEQRLARVWKEVLKAGKVGRHDHFFDLGGDSIKGIQVAARLHEKGWKLQLKDLFRYPTVAELAPYVQQVTGGQISQDEVTGEVSLSPIQRWFFDQRFEEAHHWNQAVLLESPEDLDPVALQSSFESLLHHHDALRMTYREEEGQILQWNRITTEENLYHWETIQISDIGDSLASKIEKECTRLQSRLNLAEGPLVAGGLFQTKKNDYFFVAIHHLAVDGVSWRILLEDLWEGYQQAKRSEPIQLPMKTDSFQKWSSELTQYAQGRAIKKELAYWKDVVSIPVTPLPKDGNASENRIADEDQVIIQFTREDTARLVKEANRAYRTEINDLLLTALHGAVQEWTGDENLVVDLEGHGREFIGEGIDISRTVGWFTSMFPVALTSSGSIEIGGKLQAIKEQLRRIPNKGIGYGLLAYLSSLDEKLQTYHPEIGFNYLGDFGEGLQNDKQAMTMSDISSGTSLGMANHRVHTLEINGMTLEGSLQFRVSFNRFEFKKSTIETFAEGFKRNLNQLVDYCIAQEQSVKTPSDVGLSTLPIEVWKDIQKVHSAESIEEIRPLSPMQEGILFESLMNPNSPAYFEQLSFVVNGKLEREYLWQSFQDLAVRHDILRTVFTTEGEHPLQIVVKELLLDVKEFSLLDITPDERQAAIEARKEADKEKGFDLKKGPLMRLTVLETDKEEFVLIWSHHHILMDGWCLGILLQEFLTLYAARKEGRRAELGPVESYGRYIEWLTNQDREEAKEYWREKVAGYVEQASLPKKQMTSASTYKQEELSYTMSTTLSKQVEQVARHLNSTISTVLQAAWGVLLSRYCQQEDVIFGTVVSGRPPAVKGIEKTVGLFINTIPVRFQAAKDKTFVDLVKEGQSWVVSSQEHSFLSLAEIQAESELGQGLIDHIFVVENYPFDEEAMSEKGARADLRIKNEGVFEQTSFDFNVIVVPGEQIHYAFRYNPEVYETALINYLKGHFVRVIEQVIESPETNISEVQLTSAYEQSCLQSFNDTEKDYNLEQTFVKLFEEQVDRAPFNVAVVASEMKWTYERLNQEANQLARHLQAKGLSSEQIVAILAEPSVEMILAVLAVLKAGGAYVPIDPNYPSERIQYMIKDSQAEIVITHHHLSDKVNGEREKVILEERSWVRESVENLPTSCEPNGLAYVIYTSGTTGHPKGVMIEHRSLSNLCQWHNDQFELTELDRSTKIAGFGFDASVWEIFPPLLKGAALYVVPEEFRTDIHELNKFFEQNQITISFLPTPLCEPFLALDNQSLRILLTGGDRLKTYQPVRFQLINNYGPTENTVVATSGAIDHQSTNLPIGRPIANTQVYILGKNHELQPIGVPGELCIAGDGLARGYLNQPELTAEKFIEHPHEAGSRLYRSGDLARWLPDGSIEYLGRIDDQVKIRGHRIEVGEIEAQLLKLKEVEDAVVLAHKDSDGMAYLCAYSVSSEKIKEKKVRVELAKRLPEYMIPAFFMQIDQLPLTRNGKVDRNALVEKSISIESIKSEKPRNQTEERLLRIWKEVLDSKVIGVDHNFFYKGGHSLKAASLAAKVSKEFNLDFPIRAVFENPTIAEMASFLKTIDSKKHNRITLADEMTHYPASSAQERLFIINQFDKSNISYNIPAIFTSNERIDEKKLKEVLKCLVERHESLRTSFELKAGELLQIIADEADIEVKIYYMKAVNLNEEMQKFVKPFDLYSSPLMRVNLLRLEEGTDILMVDMHHIISDGVSIDILMNDFIKLYYGEGLASLPIQYKDYAVWQKRELESDRLAIQEAYWLNQFDDELPTLELPTDFTRPAINEFIGDRFRVSIDEALYSRVKDLALATNTSIYMLLLSAYSVLLSKYSQQEDIIIGSPISGRIQEEVQGLIGMFANTLALRVNPKGTYSFSEFLQDAKEVILDAFENQEYPFEKLVEKLNIKRDVSRNAIFDTVFVLRHAETAASENSLLSPITVANPTSKFDITLEVIDDGKNLMFEWEYSTQLFTSGTIQKMAKHLIAILKSVTEHPNFLIQDIKYLSKEEEKEILVDFNATDMTFPIERTLDQMVEEQAIKSPFETALIYGERCITYRELSKQANAVASCLVQVGIQPGDHVGIIAGRHAEAVAGLLGILKTGAAYVPMEPDYPKERIRYIQEQSHITHVVLDGESRQQEEYLLPGTKVIKLEEAINSHVTKPTNSKDSSNLAYIIYTSGSTGKPKGVMIEHKSAVNLIHWVNSTYRVGPKDRLLWLTSMCFDLSVYDLFGILAAGGTVVIAQKEDVQNPLRLQEMLRKERITFWDSVPTTLNHVIRSLDESEISYLQEDLRLIFLSGDWIPVNLKKRAEVYLPNAKMIGLGGATEGTVWSNYYPIETVHDGQKSIPYGKPIGNNTFYILDANQCPVPKGVTGELYIGGIGVARGYIGDDEKTNASFMKDPFQKEETARMYRTGDLGRMISDGNMEFLGRKDYQVKVRGYRIELGEVEAQLTTHHGVKEALATVIKDGEENSGIVAYLLGDKSIQDSELRQHLLASLPIYMLPAHYIWLEKWPLSSNGKIDRKSLPNPKELYYHKEYDAPKSSMEKVLADIWKSILGIEKIGLQDDFFELGGQSLKAASLATHILKTIGIEVPLHWIFQYTTLESLSNQIENLQLKGLVGDSPVIKLQDGEDPIFCFPPVAGFGFEYKGLAQYLNERAVYGFDFIEADNRIAQYVTIIKEIQPEGPYTLLGYSAGGNLAFEVVKALEVNGDMVAKLIIMDAERNEAIGSVTNEQIIRETEEQLIAVQEKYREYLSVPAFRQAVNKRIKNYRIYLNDTVNEGSIYADIFAVRSRDTTSLGWGIATKGEYKEFQGYGKHSEMLEDPNIQENVKQVNAILSMNKKKFPESIG